MNAGKKIIFVYLNSRVFALILAITSHVNITQNSGVESHYINEMGKEKFIVT